MKIIIPLVLLTLFSTQPYGRADTVYRKDLSGKEQVYAEGVVVFSETPSTQWLYHRDGIVREGYGPFITGESFRATRSSAKARAALIEAWKREGFTAEIMHNSGLKTTVYNVYHTFTYPTSPSGTAWAKSEGQYDYLSIALKWDGFEERLNFHRLAGLEMSGGSIKAVFGDGQSITGRLQDEFYRNPFRVNTDEHGAKGETPVLMVPAFAGYETYGPPKPIRYFHLLSEIQSLRFVELISTNASGAVDSSLKPALALQSTPPLKTTAPLRPDSERKDLGNPEISSKGAGYTAYSLSAARRRIEAAGNDWREKEAEVLSLAGLNHFEGFVSDVTNKDLILFGSREKDGPPLTLDDVVVALRSRFRYRQWPAANVIPIPGPATVLTSAVHFEGEIEETSFGQTLIEAVEHLYKLAWGLEPAAVGGLRSYLGRQSGRPNTLAQPDGLDNYPRFWFHPENLGIKYSEGICKIVSLKIAVSTDTGSRTNTAAEEFAREVTERFEELCRVEPSFHRLLGLMELMAVVAGMEKLEDQLPDLGWWLNNYPLTKVETAKEVKWVRDVQANFAASHEQEASKSLLLPEAFWGKWKQKGGKSRIIIKADTVSWEREEEGSETYTAEKCKLESNTPKIAFAATEIAYWSTGTVEKPRRNIDVTLMIENADLTASIQPSRTRVPGSGLVVASPTRNLVFEREESSQPVASTHAQPALSESPSNADKAQKAKGNVLTESVAQGADSVPSAVATLLRDGEARVAWIANSAQIEPLGNLSETPRTYDIVVLDKGEPPKQVATTLRKWLEQGGIIFAFDRASGPTWRNKELFGGLIPGADKEWEPPENVMAFVNGLTVEPFDKNHPTSKGVEFIYVASDHSMVAKTGTKDFNAGLTLFDRAVDSSSVPLLKAQKVGAAVINNEPFRPGGYVTVGLLKQVGKGRVVVLPSLDYSKGSGAQFVANLVEWCLTDRKPQDASSSKAARLAATVDIIRIARLPGNSDIIATVSVKRSGVEKFPATPDAASLRLRGGRQLSVKAFLIRMGPSEPLNCPIVMESAEPGAWTSATEGWHPKGTTLSGVNLDLAPFFRGTRVFQEGDLYLEMLFTASEPGEIEFDTLRVLDLPPVEIPEKTVAFLEPPPNTVTFDNRSGEIGLVRLLGPTRNEFFVASGSSKTIHAAPGKYDLKIRYGDSPKSYSYSRGDPFDVEQTETSYSETTITLHKVPAGNYRTHPISAKDFDND